MTFNNTIAPCCFAAFVALAPYAHANQPQPGPLDSRIKTMIHKQWDVHTITGYLRRGTMIVFAPDTIEVVDGGDISAGTDKAWKVTPIKDRTMMIVRPILPGVNTNMHVVTKSPDGNKRLWAFDLIHGKTRKDGTPINGNLTYTIDMRHPNEDNNMVFSSPPETGVGQATATSVAADCARWKSPVTYNDKYSYSQKTGIVPTEMFDDGRDTWIRFGKGVPYPAVVAVNEDKSTRRVNWSPCGDYMVIHEVGKQYLFSLGKTRKVCIWNDAWTPPKPGEYGPKERKHMTKAKSTERRG